MNFINFIFLVLVSFFCEKACAGQNAQQQTFIKLNAQKGCAVNVAAWLSPSCAHCAEYFSEEIPKITAMPGFCMDLHFLPHLYLLDMPVSILIWSQGAQNVMRNAEIFFRGQDEWLTKSADGEKKSNEERLDDINYFITEIGKTRPNDQLRIRNYLMQNDPTAPDGKDPYLYLRFFVIKKFGIAHAEKFLPKGPLDVNLSTALIRSLPVKDGKAIIFSPAFTTVSGKLLPDEQLDRGIITLEKAEELLKIAGPIKPPLAAPEKNNVQQKKTPPAKNNRKKKPVQNPKNIAKKAPAPIYDDDEVQYARDEDLYNELFDEQQHHVHEQNMHNDHDHYQNNNESNHQHNDHHEEHEGINFDKLHDILQGMDDIEEGSPDEHLTA